MTKFAQFDKVTLKALRAEMQEVMNKYAVKANLEIEVGNMSFSSAEVSIKVSAKVKGAVTRTDRMLEMVAKSAGITNFKNAKGDTLTGYNSRSHKYPYQYVCGTTGKNFKCTAEGAIQRFK